MNEEALKVLYSLAQGDGYQKSFEDFTVLMSENESAVNTMFGVAQSDGYSKDMDAFKTLVGFSGGVKKKEESEFVSPLEMDFTEYTSPLVPKTTPSASSVSEDFVGTAVADPQVFSDMFAKQQKQNEDYKNFFLERENKEAEKLGVFNVVQNSFKSAVSNYEKSYKDTQAFLYDSPFEKDLISDSDEIARDNKLRRDVSLNQLGVSEENREKNATELLFQGNFSDGLKMLFADGLTAAFDAPRTLLPFLVPGAGPVFTGITSASQEAANLRYDPSLSDVEKKQRSILSGFIEGASTGISQKLGVGLPGLTKKISPKAAEGASDAVQALRGFVTTGLGEGVEEGFVDVANQVKDKAFDLSYGRESQDFNLYQALDAAFLGTIAGSAVKGATMATSLLPSTRKAGHSSTVEERSEIEKEVQELSRSYFNEADPDIRKAKEKKLNEALNKFDSLLKKEGDLHDAVEGESKDQLVAINRRIANLKETLKSGKDAAGIKLNSDQIANQKAELNNLFTIKKEIEDAVEQPQADPVQPEPEPTPASQKLDLSEYDLVKDISSGDRYRKIERGSGPEGTSVYVKEGTDVYRDADGVLRPSADEQFAMAGETIGDKLMDLVEEGKPKEAPVQPEAVETPAETDQPSIETEAPQPDPPQQTPQQRLQALKDDGVFIKDEGLKSKVVDAKQRYFSARRHLPKSVFEAKEKKEALIAKELSVVEQSIAEFNRLLKGVDGDQAKESFTADFDDAIRGGEGLNRLTPEAQELAISLRNQIDRLSIELINEGLVPSSQIDKVIANLGQYLTRSYKVYDRENWKSQVEDQTIEQAKNFIRPSLSEKADRLVNTDANVQGLDRDAFLESLVQAEIDKYLNPSEVKAFAQAGMGKDLKIFEQRQEIPKQIRALMGEYANPVQNYAKSVLRMSATLEAQRFLNKTAKLGAGKFLQSESTGIFTDKIEGTGSELDGMFTTPEIAQEFQRVEENTGAFLDAYFKVIVGTKYAKTILSLGTHGKNVFGNLGFMYANGHLFEVGDLGSAMNDAYKTIKNDFRGKDNKALNERMNEYIELGIVKQSASIGEIRDMFKDANMSVAMENRLNNQKLTLKNQTLSAARETGKFFEDAYQAEDDFFKIVAFEIEKSRYAKALLGKSKSDLMTAEQETFLNEYVAAIVKNTYPTYSRVPEAIKMIRRNPLIGNFVSFQAESYRVAYNTIQLGFLESSSDNPEIRKIGAKRLAGAASYQAGKSAVIAAFGVAVGVGAQGLVGMFSDSEEEKQRRKDIRLFSPDWTQKANLLMLRFGDGKFAFIDVSSSDPYGNFDRIANSIIEGESIGESFGDALFQIVEPFIGVDIATRRFGNIAYNRKDTGGKIYNEADTYLEQGKDILKYLYEGTIEPGTFKSIRKIYNSDDKLVELVGQLTGLKPYRIDVREQLGYRLRDLQKDLVSARNIRYEDVNRANEQLFIKEQEVAELMHAAERNGVPKEDIFKIAKEARLGVANYTRIYRGEKPNLTEPK